MDRIEKLFLLQKVDLLQGAKSSDLGLLASIAEEVEVEKGVEIIAQGKTNDALYVVVRGSVELTGMGDQRMMAGEDTPFGTWALIDSDPSVVSARAAESSLLLRITRNDFRDLLADHPELAMGMLQGLARRIRGLVA
jgi:CRP/FNR family transcriptional regulator